MKIKDEIKKEKGETETEEYDVEFLGFNEKEFRAIKELLKRTSFSFTNPNPERFSVLSMTVNEKRAVIEILDKTGEIKFAIKNDKKYILGEPLSTGKQKYTITVENGQMSVRTSRDNPNPHRYSSEENVCTGNSKTPEEFLLALDTVNMDSIAHHGRITDKIDEMFAEDKVKPAGWGEVKEDENSGTE